MNGVKIIVTAISEEAILGIHKEEVIALDIVLSDSSQERSFRIKGLCLRDAQEIQYILCRDELICEID